jgi:hypothetical protein
MWHVTATAESSATPAQLWARYADVPNWTDWDEGLEHVSLDGPFAVGVSGRLKPAGAPTSFPFTLTRVDVERGFSDVTPIPHRALPLVRLVFDHELTPTATGTRITHRVAFRGPLGWLFRLVAGKGFHKDVPDAVNSLARRGAA